MTTRERLTKEATRQFAEQGYHGTSINDLAQALGIQKSSVYAHIRGKEDLLNEITSSGADHFHRALDQVDELGGIPSERLHAALRAHLGVVRSQVNLATVWLKEWRFLEGVARKRFLSERRRYERRIETLFREAIDAGELPHDLDLGHAVLLFFSIGNWAYTWISATTDVESEADAFWSLMLHGVAGEPPG
jgi:AcrR family transcriptional regulator